MTALIPQTSSSHWCSALILCNYLLYYCNSLYYGIADGLMRHLQLVQHAAAPLITGVRQCKAHYASPT